MGLASEVGAGSAADVLLALWGSDGSVKLSAGVAQILGPPAEWTPKRILSSIHPADRKGVLRVWREAGSQDTSGGDPLALPVVRILSSSGRWRTFSGGLFCLHSPPAHPERLAVLTPREEGDDPVAGRYRELVEAGDIGMGVVDGAGEIVWANPAALRIMGEDDPGDLIGRNILDYVVLTDIAPAVERLRAAVQDGDLGPEAVFQAIVARDGRMILARTGSMLTEWEGKPALLVTLLDVTDLMDTSDAEPDVNETVVSRERRFRGIVQYSTDMTFLLGRDRKILWCSDAAREGLRVRMGTQWPEGIGIHEDDLFGLEAAFAAVTSGGHGGRGGQKVTFTEFRVVDGDNWRWMEGTLANHLEDTDIRGYVLNAREVTDRKRAEIALRDRLGGEQLHKQVSAALAAVSTLEDFEVALDTVLGFVGAFTGATACELCERRGANVAVIRTWRRPAGTRALVQGPATAGIASGLPAARYGEIGPEHQMWRVDVDVPEGAMDAGPCPLRTALRQAGMRSVAIFPVGASWSESRGWLHVYSEQDDETRRKWRRDATGGSHEDGWPGGFDLYLRSVVELVGAAWRRVDASTELREAERRSRGILDALDVGVIIHDAHVRYLNPAARRMLIDGDDSGGTGGEEAGVGDRVLDFVVGGSDSAAAEHLTCDNPGSQHVELRLRSRSGREIPARVKSVSTTWDGARVLQTTIVDLTEFKEAQDRWKLTNELFKSGFEHSPAGMCLISQDGVVRRANTSLATLMGLDSPDELVGRQMWDFMGSEDRRSLQQRVRQLYDDADVYGLNPDVGSEASQDRPCFEMRAELIGPDGSARRASLAGALVSARTAAGMDGEADPGEQLTRPLLYLQLHDESAIVEAEEAMRASEARYRRLVENAPDLIYRYRVWPEEERGFEYVNGAVRSLLGYEPQDFYADSEIHMRLLHPDDREDGDLFFQKGADRPITMRWITSDGSEVWLEHRSVDVREPGEPGAGPGRLVAWEGICRDVTRTTRVEEELIRRQLRDPLTDTLNRTFWLSRAEDVLVAARASGRGAGVAVVDVDRMTAVNSAFGFEVGDSVLRRVTEVCGRLAGVDGVGRESADRFAVLLEAADGEELREKLERLSRELSAPFVPKGHDREIRVGVSIGAAFAGPRSSRAIDAAVLLRRSQVALFRAKQSGGGLCVYDASRDHSVASRISTEMDLRRGLDQGEFRPVFQPIVCVRAGSEGLLTRSTLEPVAAEALARWQHPTRGRLSPAEFLPLAEAYNMISRLGEQVLDAACAEYAMWCAAGADLGLHVNLSAIQLSEPEMVDRFASLLQRHGIKPGDITLEVTETAVLAELDSRRRVLDELYQVGFRIALDDFGVGYSSLRHLKDLPVDEVKIDRSFVAGLDADPPVAHDVAIVRSAVGLAAAFGLVVTAEGVETDRQWLRLMELADLAGATYLQGQGWLFGRPAPGDEFTELVGKLRAAGGATGGRRFRSRSRSGTPKEE